MSCWWKIHYVWSKRWCSVRWGHEEQIVNKPFFLGAHISHPGKDFGKHLSGNICHVLFLIFVWYSLISHPTCTSIGKMSNVLASYISCKHFLWNEDAFIVNYEYIDIWLNIWEKGANIQVMGKGVYIFKWCKYTPKVAFECYTFSEIWDLVLSKTM